MNAVKILVLCITAALICASIRSVHPQMAAAVALAAGVAAMLLSQSDIAVFSNAIRALDELGGDASGRLALVKLCALAMVAEFASDICRDSGENALAKRIDMGVRIGVVASAIPSVAGIMSAIAGVIK